jgi:hypothetical protein
LRFEARQSRLRILDALEERAKQFRGRDDIWPFRVPHEPLQVDLEEVRPRSVLRMEWTDARWELWAIVLPSGILLYGDADGHETRVLASVRRGNPSEADGFFLERLAESRGHHFGIELAGPPPQRVRSSIGDREFLTDVFVELFEGTDAETSFRLKAEATGSRDFRADVAAWLARVLTAPPGAKRQPRLADAQP